MFLLSSFITSLVFIFIMLFAISFLTLWERKLLAGIQRRQGPVFAGIIGILQPFADGLKLMFKTFNMPTGAYYYIFIGSSIFSLTLSLLSWTVLPFTKFFVFADVNCSLLLILLISSLGKLTILFSGWSSNSKYGVLGSIRSGAQMASYEVPLLLSLFPIILLSSELNLTNIANIQTRGFWFIFIVSSALIFFICSLAETNRPPFDLPEAESELVAGYNIEYSSLSFAVFFLAEYNHVISSSVLFSILFLGGWSTYPFSVLDVNAVEVSSNFAMVCTLIFKSIIIINLFIYVRAVLPRYKFTDLISMCWQVFVPVTLLTFLFIWYIQYLNFTGIFYCVIIAGLSITFFIIFFWIWSIFDETSIINEWYAGYYEETEENKFDPFLSSFLFKEDKEKYQTVYGFFFLWFVWWNTFVMEMYSYVVLVTYFIYGTGLCIMMSLGYFIFLKE